MSSSPAVRMIMLQFSFSNQKQIPAWVPESLAETAEDAAERAATKVSSIGAQYLPPTERLDIGRVPDELETAGFVFNDCFWQARYALHTPKYPSYYAVRYLFWRRDFAHQITEHYAPHLARARAGLTELCEQNFWRARSYQNPFVIQGQVIPDTCAISLNLEVRVPRIESNGKPVVQWRKDEASRRIGSAPEPIWPSGQLTFNGSLFCLV